MNEFLDAQQGHNKNPNTFWIPSQEEINNLRVGNYVKICENKERFWVELTLVDLDGGKLVGRVDNDLVHSHSFKYNDIIKFEKKNVMGIMTAPPEDEL
jgi:hypothetical protein